MIKELIKLADHLDKKGLHKEADYVDWIVRKSSIEKDMESIAREEIDSFLEKLKAYVKRYENMDGPGHGYIVETILRDFERYLDYLKNPRSEKFDMGSINMMIREYPKTADLDSDSKIRLVSDTIEKLKDIADPHRHEEADSDSDFHHYV